MNNHKLLHSYHSLCPQPCNLLQYLHLHYQLQLYNITTMIMNQGKFTWDAFKPNNKFCSVLICRPGRSFHISVVSCSEIVLIGLAESYNLPTDDRGIKMINFYIITYIVLTCSLKTPILLPSSV